MEREFRKMSNFRRTLLLALIPTLLFGVLWNVNWRRRHPPPTMLDEQIRTRLLSADTVEVEIENVEAPVGGVTTFVTYLSSGETHGVARYINLTQEQPSNWGTGYVPTVYLNFYKKGQAIGSLCTSYSAYGFNYFLDAPSQAKIRRGLHPTSLLRLRELIARHPEIIRALIKGGAETKYLAPGAFTKNRA